MARLLRGLPWWLAPALSLAAFAGSLELLLVGMMATATPLAAVALTVLVVNFRHVFYAFSFPLHVVKSPLAKAYAVYAMIDEAYAVNASLPEAQRSAPRLLAMQVACETYWVGGGLVGVAMFTALLLFVALLLARHALTARRTARRLAPRPAPRPALRPASETADA
ncbi:AzlC family ABC transporter permease [Nonomuraea sp. NBC_00507]|uniref:AzlC family ABC transporter permease n=1 Tax=Nonomuraea sp. NBC_00507 TaxID=2976002 RepID=UPI002E18E79F